MIGRGRNLAVPRDIIRVRVRGSRAVRLDHFLKEALAWRSRARIQRLIRAGRVTVDGRTTKPAMLVRPGDEVEVRLSQGTGLPDYAARPLERLYEDPWLLSINKPPGLLVHPVGRHVYDTLLNYLHHRYRDVMEAQDASPTADAAARRDAIHLRLCHRIDRDTTGVLLIGKEGYVHRSVQRQLQSRAVKKRYLALARGRVPAELDSIDRPLAEGRTLEQCLGGSPQKPSRTRIEVLEVFEHCGETYTWLAADPLSGRQNQIRLHLAAIGHPLVGDERFGDGPPPAEFPQRFVLHARRIRFWHPRLKSQVELEAPLPADVESLLETLREGSAERRTEQRSDPR